MGITSEEAKFKELKDKMRRQVGNPSLTQFMEEQADDAVKSAIREYSKHKPIEVLDYLTTIKDEQAYDLSTKSRIIRVKEVYYSTGSEYFPEEVWSDFSMYGRLEGLSLFENPSLWTQYMQRLEQFKAMFNGDFSFEQSTKILRLIPAPSEMGEKVYYIWTQRHTAETIPEDDIDLVLLWAKGEAKEMMASKKGNEVQSVSGYGESVTFGATSDSLMKEAQNFKERFEKKFSGSVFIVG
jgi:hypothetical protein